MAGRSVGRSESVGRSDGRTLSVETSLPDPDPITTWRFVCICFGFSPCQTRKLKQQQNFPNNMSRILIQYSRKQYFCCFRLSDCIHRDKYLLQKIKYSRNAIFVGLELRLRIVIVKWIPGDLMNVELHVKFPSKHIFRLHWNTIDMIYSCRYCRTSRWLQIYIYNGNYIHHSGETDEANCSWLHPVSRVGNYATAWMDSWRVTQQILYDFRNRFLTKNRRARRMCL